MVRPLGCLAPAETLRRYALAVLVALGLAGASLALPGAPAHAALHNPIPFNATGEPAYEFVDDDALFVYVTSDIAGGTVCIVRATVPVAELGSCKRPAWGTPNHIVGIGSVIQPIEGPSLMPGEWKLLTEDSTGTPTELSEAFTVTSCADCSREFALAAINQWKDRARDMRLGLGLACTAFAVKDIAGEVTAARGSVHKATDRADAYEAGEVGFKATIAGAAGGLLGFAFPSFPSIDPTGDKALEILHDLSCAAGAMYFDIENDPPDPGYGQVASPRFARIGTSGSADLDALMTALDRQSAFGEVALTSYERYLGAREDSNSSGEARQAAAAGELTLSQVDEMRNAARALAGYADLLRQDPEYTTPIATPEQWTAIQAAYARISQQGFDPAERAQMEAAGLDADQIAAIRTHFQVSLDGFDPSLSVVDHLDRLAATTNDSLAGFDAFAREAGAVGARIASDHPNQAPVASFTRTPDAGPAPLAVSVDASGSSDADGVVASYDWAFGDGATATGQQATHEYTAPGDYTITLTVTDNLGATASATRLVRVTDPDVPNTTPSATDLAVSTTRDTALPITLSGTDPDGDTLTFAIASQPAHGSLSGSGADRTYTPDAGFVGVDTFTYRVSDGLHDSAPATVTIDVRAPGPVNRAPTAYPGGYSTPLDTPVVDLLHGSDPEGTPVTLSVTVAPKYGTVSEQDGRWTYTPNPGFRGMDAVVFVASDGELTSDPALVTIAVGDPEGVLVGDEVFTVARGLTLEANVLSNDYSPNYGLHLTGFTPASDGTASCDLAAGTCRYTADGTATTDSFTYTVEDAQGHTGVGTVHVTVVDDNAPPVITQLTGPAEVGEGGAYELQYAASDPDGQVVSYRWSSSDAADARYPFVFRDEGEKTVTLTVTDNRGAHASRTVPVTVVNLPPSVIGYGGPAGRWRTGREAVLGVNLTDPGPDDVLHVSWDFGDGGTAATPTAPHTWTSPGTYDVVVTVTDEDGGRTVEKVATVNVADHATVDAGPDVSGDEGTPLAFDFTGSTPPDANASYRVDWGDGSSSSVATLDPTHTYASPGAYQVVLTLTDFLAPEGESTLQDSVTATVANLPPRVAIASRSITPVGAATAFRALWTDPGGPDPGDEVSWDFGDGGAGSGASTSHVFDQAGTRDVTVTVTQADGSAVRATEQVQVVAGLGRTPTSSGREFWLAFDANYFPDDTSALTVFVASETATSGLVAVPGLQFRAPFTVSAGDVTPVSIPIEAMAGQGPNLSAEHVQQLAVHVVADDPVTVYGLNRQRFTTDAFLGLPVTAAGTRYRVTDYPSGVGGQLSVVAAEGPTRVHLVPPPSSFREPFDVDLELGDVFEWELGNGSLTGTVVTADRPVSVFGGNRCANVPEQYAACDHLVEQLAPTPTWGRSFATMPLFGRTQDTFRILADEDGTTVTVTDPSGSHDVRLSAGEFHEFLSGNPQSIVADKPISVAQYSNGSTFDNTVSDPFMVMVPALEQGYTDSIFATPPTGFRVHYANLTAPTASVGTVTLDGSPVEAAQWREIPGTALSGTTVALEGGRHRIRSNVPVGTVVYGFDEYDSYGFPGGFRLAAVATAAHLVLSPESRTGTAGDTLCTTATLTDGDGQGIAGARVDLTATGVVEEQRSIVTGGTGSAEYCLSSATAGGAEVAAASAGLTATGTFTWREADTNRAPVAHGLAVSTDAGTPVDIGLSGEDPDGDPVTFRVVDPPAHGTLSGTGPRRTYTPADGFDGTDEFTYVADDGTLSSDPARVSITVRPPVNVDPVAVFSTSPRAGVTTLPTRFDATASVDPDGTITAYSWEFGDGTTGTGVTPEHTFTAPGDHQVRLTVTDDDGGHASVQHTVHVLDAALLDVPLCGDQDGSAPVVLRCPAYDREPGVETWQVGRSGRVTFDYVYRNAADADQLSFYVVDDEAGTVDGVAPGSPGYLAAVLGRARNVFALGSDASAPDHGFDLAPGSRLAFYVSPYDNDRLAAMGSGQVVHFSVAAANPDRTTHALAFDGADVPAEFTFEDREITDSEAPDWDDLVFTADGISSGPPVNHAPVATDLGVTTHSGEAVGVDLVATDPDGEPVSYQVASQPAHGSLSGSGSSRTYTSDAGFVGVDTFTYTATDGDLVSAPATVTVTVLPPPRTNQPPVAAPADLTTRSDEPLDVTLGGSDPDGDALSPAVVTPPEHGSLSGTGPTRRYTPDAGFVGTDSLTFTVSDGELTSAPATITITVEPPLPTNHPPVARSFEVATPGTPVPVTLRAEDPDGDPLTYLVASTPSHGTLSGNAPELVYTPDAGYVGPDSFTYTADDGDLTAEPATVSITVTEPPTATSPAVDVVVSANQASGTSTVTSPRFSTAGDDELLVAYVSGDGPNLKTQEVRSLTGGNLVWTLVERANATGGTTEVWQAHAATRLTNVAVNAKLTRSGYDATITVVAYTGAADSVRAVGSTGRSGNPSVTITPSAVGSLIWSVGHDWSTATAPTAPTGVTFVHRFRDKRVKDYFWVQKNDLPTTDTSPVTVRNGGITEDRWQLVAVEIPPRGAG